MRVLVWASTLQADILALARQLDQRPDTDLLVAAEGLEAWRREPIARALPFRARMLDRAAPTTPADAMAFRADVVVCDNHFPEFPAAPRVCWLWHGLGWKAKDSKDVEVNAGHIGRLTGIDPRRPNPRFLAQCYHARDRDWRIRSWGFAPANCLVTGSCFSDLILAPPYSRADLAPHYRIDITGRRTLLLNFGWHYGRIFPGTWQPKRFGRSPMEADVAFIRSLFARADAQGVNVLFCLHDRWRYETAYLEALHREAGRFPHVEFKHKNERPDNLADLVVADAWVSNLSSFVTFFYHTGRPSVHLCPRPGATIRFSRVTRLGLRARPAEPAAEWMNQPEDNGGLTAYDAGEALTAVDRALTEPDCCRERARRWLDDHVEGSDGQASRRLADAIAGLCARQE
jgi:hypothetical protein